MEFWLISSEKVAVGLRTVMASGWFNMGEDVRWTSFAKTFDVVGWVEGSLFSLLLFVWAMVGLVGLNVKRSCGFKKRKSRIRRDSLESTLQIEVQRNRFPRASDCLLECEFFIKIDCTVF